MNTKNIFSVFFLTTSFVTMSQTDIQYLSNKNGATLGYSTTSGVKILTIGGKHFKDLNKNGKLDNYTVTDTKKKEVRKYDASKKLIETKKL